MSQQDKARLFASLHRPGDPVILYNAWDAGSAQAVADAGAAAIATGSASVAAAHGFHDAEALPLDLAIANAERVVAAVELPVTIDFEGGYAVEPEPLAANMKRLAATGAIGCNFEDQVVGGEGLHPVEAQAERLRAARAAVGPDFFLNARTDIFLKAKAETHDDAKVGRGARPRPRLCRSRRERLLRARPRRFEAARTRLRDLPAAGQLHGLSRRAFAADVAAAGIARISHGPFPYRLAMKALKEAAEAFYRG